MEYLGLKLEVVGPGRMTNDKNDARARPSLAPAKSPEEKYKHTAK